jgi:hypothetical protein
MTDSHSGYAGCEKHMAVAWLSRFVICHHPWDSQEAWPNPASLTLGLHLRLRFPHSKQFIFPTVATEFAKTCLSFLFPYFRKTGRLGFNSRRGHETFLYLTASRPALGLTQSYIQWLPRFFSPGVKRPGCESDHSPYLEPRWRIVGLYLHSLTRLNGVVNVTLILYFYLRKKQLFSYHSQ